MKLFSFFIFPSLTPLEASIVKDYSHCKHRCNNNKLTFSVFDCERRQAITTSFCVVGSYCGQSWRNIFWPEFLALQCVAGYIPLSDLDCWLRGQADLESCSCLSRLHVSIHTGPFSFLKIECARPTFIKSLNVCSIL